MSEKGEVVGFLHADGGFRTEESWHKKYPHLWEPLVRKSDYDALRKELDESIKLQSQLFVRGREWAELSGRYEAERDALADELAALEGSNGE